jgi:hypothetical protein
MYHVYAFRKHISERGREPLRRDSDVTGQPLPHQVEQAIASSIPRLGQTRRNES